MVACNVRSFAVLALGLGKVSEAVQTKTQTKIVTKPRRRVQKNLLQRKMNNDVTRPLPKFGLPDFGDLQGNPAPLATVADASVDAAPISSAPTFQDLTGLDADPTASQDGKWHSSDAATHVYVLHADPAYAGKLRVPPGYFKSWSDVWKHILAHLEAHPADIPGSLVELQGPHVREVYRGPEKSNDGVLHEVFSVKDLDEGIVLTAVFSDRPSLVVQQGVDPSEPVGTAVEVRVTPLLGQGSNAWDLTATFAARSTLRDVAKRISEDGRLGREHQKVNLLSLRRGETSAAGLVGQVLYGGPGVTKNQKETQLDQPLVALTGGNPGPLHLTAGFDADIPAPAMLSTTPIGSPSVTMQVVTQEGGELVAKSTSWTTVQEVWTTVDDAARAQHKRLTQLFLGDTSGKWFDALPKADDPLSHYMFADSITMAAVLKDIDGQSGATPTARSQRVSVGVSGSAVVQPLDVIEHWEKTGGPDADAADASDRVPQFSDHFITKQFVSGSRAAQISGNSFGTVDHFRYPAPAHRS